MVGNREGVAKERPEPDARIVRQCRRVAEQEPHPGQLPISERRRFRQRGLDGVSGRVAQRDRLAEALRGLRERGQGIREIQRLGQSCGDGIARIVGQRR